MERRNIMLRALLISAVAAVVNAQCPEPPAGGCSICGQGLCVTNPEAIFVFPGQPEVPCGLLEQAGLSSQIPLDQCPFLPGLASVCECGVIDNTAAPATALAPTSAPFPAPTSGSCPEVPSGGCSICGEGLCVQNPAALFTFPGQPIVPCGQLEMAGATGAIPLTQCGFLPSFVTVCECGSPETSPVAPTVAPTAPPTSSPVVMTPSPVVITPSPVVITPSPVVITPSPVVMTPSPVVMTPSPVVMTPSPVVITPSPAVITPAPAITQAPSPLGGGSMGMGGAGGRAKSGKMSKGGMMEKKDKADDSKMPMESKSRRRTTTRESGVRGA